MKRWSMRAIVAAGLLPRLTPCVSRRAGGWR